MIAELAAAALGGFLAAGTGWLLDRQREAAKSARTRHLLTRAIYDDLTYSLQIYDKISEEWDKTKIAWFSTLNELRESRQPYLERKDLVVMLDDEDLRRHIFRYYLQSSDRISLLENAQRRKYELERTFNDIIRQIQMKDENATQESAKDAALKIMMSEDNEWKNLVAEMPNHVNRVVSLKATAQELTRRLQPKL